MVILSGLFMYDGQRGLPPAQVTESHRGMIAEWSDAIVAGILALLAGIVWLVRLEGKSNRYEDLAKRLDDHIANDEITHSKMLDDLSEIREGVSLIKGYLSRRNH